VLGLPDEAALVELALALGNDYTPAGHRARLAPPPLGSCAAARAASRDELCAWLAAQPAGFRFEVRGGGSGIWDLIWRLRWQINAPVQRRE
jgi:hypothetical protein